MIGALVQYVGRMLWGGGETVLIGELGITSVHPLDQVRSAEAVDNRREVVSVGGVHTVEKP